MVSNGGHLHIISGSKKKRREEDNLDCVQEDASMKETQDRKDSEQKDTNVDETVDHISQLPDHIIHQILSYLRNVKDAVRTSILSKKWRTIWYSFSVLIFDERKFAAEEIGDEDGRNKESMFRNYVSQALLNHHAKKSYIQNLVVHMTSFDLFQDTKYLDLWLSIGIYRDIKELDLHVGIKNDKRYTLPSSVFSSKSLTGIRLSGCELTCDNVALPNLQKLYLHKIPLVEHFTQKLISSCHSIEDIRIIKCFGLKRLQVSNLSKLKRVEIHHCTQLKKVVINAPNLDTFWYCGKKTTPCKVSLVECTSLKRLTLEHPQVTRDFCENKFSNFPVLEKLHLSMSDNKCKYIIISNPHLQKFTLKGCQKLRMALIDASNLVSFECKGESMPWVEEINPFSFTNAKLYFVSNPERRVVGYGDKSWISVKSFIEKFNPEEFELVLYSNKNIVIHEDLNHVTIPPVPDLGCEIIKSSACIDDILYSLLRRLHPVTVSIISSPDSKFPKSVYEMIKIKDEDRNCCMYNASNNKCWRHFLKDVNLEDLNHVKFEDTKLNKRTSTWYSWLKSEYTTLECEVTNLRLCWNSR